MWFLPAGRGAEIDLHTSFGTERKIDGFHYFSYDTSVASDRGMFEPLSLKHSIYSFISFSHKLNEWEIMNISSRIKRGRSMKTKTRRPLLHLLLVVSMLLVNPLCISASSLNSSGSTLDPYKILGVTKSSSQDEIKKVCITTFSHSFSDIYCRLTLLLL